DRQNGQRDRRPPRVDREERLRPREPVPGAHPEPGLIDLLTPSGPERARRESLSASYPAGSSSTLSSLDPRAAPTARGSFFWAEGPVGRMRPTATGRMRPVVRPAHAPVAGPHMCGPLLLDAELGERAVAVPIERE